MARLEVRGTPPWTLVVAPTATMTGMGATFQPDCFTAQYFPIDGQANFTVLAPLNAVKGYQITLAIRKSFGPLAVTFSSPPFKSNYAPPTTIGKTNTVTFTYDGTSWVQTGAVSLDL